MGSTSTRRDVIRASGTAVLIGSGAAIFAMPGGASASRQDAIEIRAAGFVESQVQLQHTVDVLERYEENNPNVSISPEFTDYDSYTTKLATEAAGGNAPDMMSTNADIMGEYSRRGVLMPLDEFVPDQLNLSDYSEGTVEGNRIDGGLYGIPNDCISPSLIYNTTLVEDAGVAVPDDMWTWEEFEQLANDLSEALGEGVYGTEDVGRSYTICDMFLRGRGKEFYSAERGLGFAEEDLAAWYEMWQRLRESGGAPPGEVQAEAATDDQSRSLLITGQAVMQPQLSDSYFGFQSLTENVLGIHLLPNGFDGGELQQHHYAYAGNSTSISANTDNVDTVIDIIRFMQTDPDGIAVFYQGSGLVPPSAAARAELREVASAGEERILNYMELVLEDPAQPRNPSVAGVSGILGRMNEEVAFERLSVDEAVEQFFSEAEQAMR